MRFEREAKASAQLRTRNVVQVFDYGVDSDIPYIAME
jgi:serine/threonine-protein kinase